MMFQCLFYSCDLIVTEENTDCYWEKTGTNFCRKSTNCDTIDNIIDCNENPECFWEKGFGIFNKNECKPFRDCDDSNKEQCNANPKCYWTTIDTKKCSKREGAADACGDISNVDECSQTEGCSWSEEKCQAEAEIEGSDPYVPVFNLKTGLRRGSKYARRRLDNSISKERDLKVLIGNWSKYLLSLTAVIAVISIIWAGVLYITDFGDGSRKDNAKKILMLTVIGIVLIFGSYAIVRSVMKGSLDGGRADINFVIEMRSKANI